MACAPADARHNVVDIHAKVSPKGKKGKAKRASNVGSNPPAKRAKKSAVAKQADEPRFDIFGGRL